ncbi:MAG: quinol dehydrogenase ferredoxin subunit NapH, partial [Xanthomonadales bacterium]|nr:quinol dehydrogenase ferredoxin subunit NapH [Xanthomonadales bacterium]NIX13708.1 quinol dehydrogenase ferredoxin subunit NapH [Xanthomonadales bacterium]
ERLGIPKGWQPKRTLRYWILGMTLAASATTGVIVWELVNPITLLHRALLYGLGAAWAAVLAVF